MKKIAIVGCGIVGGGVAEILSRNAESIAAKAHEGIEVKYIVDLRDMPDSPFHHLMVKDFALAEQDPEIFAVVEAIGGCGAALNFCTRALKAGKHVVTSNKQLVAEHGLELIALAQEHNCSFLFEASVGGGIPVLHPMIHCLDANILYEVSGILNGTTNFILTQMLENGMTYEAALKQAQQNGYAESDPTADVEGIDAGRKACILADLAYGLNVSPEKISMEGITGVTAADAAFAEAGGMKIKLLGRAIREESGKLFVFVAPHFVPQSSCLAGVNGVFNAIQVSGSDIGTAMFYGLGAGRYATASAVLGDVIDIVRNPGRPQPAVWQPGGDALLQDPAQFRSRFFIRTKADKADVEARLGDVLWLPDQQGWNGGITGVTSKQEIAASGFTPDALMAIYDR